MERRHFLKNVALGGAMLGSSGISSHERPLDILSKKNETSDPFVFEEFTITDFQTKMETGELTSKKIIETYLERIKQLDQNGPALNSVLQLNPDALNIASKLDEERRNGTSRGPLHGIPLLIKGNINTKDKMNTSGGSLALKDNLPKNDAPFITQLRDAGVVILGKTNLSEWANFRSSQSSSGWSSAGGLTKNPYILHRNPGGSSSGSAVAISANMSAIAIGTETDGSIVCPSSVNGIVGIKPTVGLVSNKGIIPISQTCDTAGPMARTISDAAALLTSMVDTTNPSIKQKASSDYTSSLNMDGLNNKRIGILNHFFHFHERVDVVIQNAVKVIEQNGAELVYLNDAILTNQNYQDQWSLFLHEFKTGINEYLSGSSNSTISKSLQDIIRFNKEHSKETMPFFGQDILELAEKTPPLSPTKHKEIKVRLKEQVGSNGIDHIMNDHHLDALIAPTSGAAWVTDLINGDHHSGGCSTLTSLSGYPHITVPAGFVHGLPIGLSFIGKAFSEPQLIELAYAFEQHSKIRKTPQFLSSPTP